MTRLPFLLSLWGILGVLAGVGLLRLDTASRWPLLCDLLWLWPVLLGDCTLCCEPLGSCNLCDGLFGDSSLCEAVKSLQYGVRCLCGARHFLHLPKTSIFSVTEPMLYSPIHIWSPIVSHRFKNQLLQECLCFFFFYDIMWFSSPRFTNIVSTNTNILIDTRSVLPFCMVYVRMKKMQV